jgi:hydrogenase maturation factor
MCLALTGRVVAVEGDGAVVEVAGRHLPASRLLAPEVRAGDWVTVGAGWVLARLTEVEASARLAMEGRGVDDATGSAE